MKNERQELILEIIRSEEIETQEQLIERLRARGVMSTQATISRDIKQLHVIKEPTGGGSYRYSAAGQGAQHDFDGRLQNILRESITGAERAQNLVVIKTMPGSGGAAGAALDRMGISQLVGSLAGDDTVLLVMRDTKSAAAICAELTAILDKHRK